MSASGLKELSSNRCFGGYQKVFVHDSKECKLPMKFSIYLPDSDSKEPLPVLFWLSGLTCTHENFIFKSGFQRYADRHKSIVVCPDTSPRGAEIPGEEDSWDFGSGAGFYVDATLPPYDTHYRMYSYISSELRELIHETFPTDPDRTGIFGHSMGGHGAMVIGLRNPQHFHSISAFAPISQPTECPWGLKAFGGYLGENRSMWRDYDASILIEEGVGRIPILVDQGLNDEFLESQLRTSRLEDISKARDFPLNLRLHEGYDHSYYFIATFLEDHFQWHIEQWTAKGP